MCRNKISPLLTPLMILVLGLKGHTDRLHSWDYLIRVNLSVSVMGKGSEKTKMGHEHLLNSHYLPNSVGHLTYTFH